jgi:hypothetical protein
MTLLRKIAVFSVFLVFVLGSGNLCAIEIDTIDGRPWDDGNIDDPGESNQDNVFDKDPGFNFPLDDDDFWDYKDETESFKKFFRGILSFLDY